MRSRLHGFENAFNPNTHLASPGSISVGRDMRFFGAVSIAIGSERFFVVRPCVRIPECVCVQCRESITGSQASQNDQESVVLLKLLNTISMAPSNIQLDMLSSKC